MIYCENSENPVIDFQSNSTVPPSIVDEGTVMETKVKEKHNITLTCEASGNNIMYYISALISKWYQGVCWALKSL